MWLKRLKYFFIGLGIIIVIAITTVFTILYFYEEEIKEFALAELNQNLDTELKVGEIELSVFDQFPSIAIKFNDLLIEDIFIEKDTFLFASELYMNMDFFDALAGDYNVKKIIGDRVNLKLKVDSSGNGNYDIWKSDTISKKQDIQFVLKQVEINNLLLAYDNNFQDQHYSFFTNHIDFSGDFKKNIYDLSARSKLFIKEFTADKVNYLTNKNADIDLDLKVNNDSSTYLINKGVLKIEGMHFDVNGFYQNLENPYVDLNFKGKNIVLESLFSVFPLDVLTALNEYKTKGNVAFNAQLKGNISNEYNPVFKADFKMESGQMEERQTATILKDILLEGSFVNINNEGYQQLNFDKVYGKLGSEAVSGSLSITNFNSPTVQGKINGIITLEKLTEFANFSAFNLGGNANLKLAYKIKFNESGDDYKINLLDGDVKVQNMHGDFLDEKLALAQTNGRFYFQNKAFQSNWIKGETNGSPFTMQLKFDNFLEYITAISENLVIHSDVSINKLNLEQLFSSSDNNTDELGFQLPSQIKLYSKLKVNVLQYKTFNAANFSASIFMDNKFFKAEKVNFYANKGEYKLNSILENSTVKNYQWTVNGNAKAINVQDLFYSLENFGQDYLTNMHLKGTADIDFKMNSFLDRALNLDPYNVTATSKIKIKNGELIDHSSMNDIGEYLHGNPIIKRVFNTELLKKNLKHIYFSELSNEVAINKGKIDIPKMDISSNVMNMSLLGSHGFNDTIDYHFSFRLRELMVKDDSENEFGPIKDDGLGKIIYLKMYGSVDDPQFKIDKEEKKENFKENLNKEKQTVKSILNEEIGLFSKDSTITKQKEKKDTTIFEIEWEEETKETNSKSSNQTTKEKDTPKKKNGKLNKFLKKIGVEEEEKKEVEFEIDQNF